MHNSLLNLSVVYDVKFVTNKFGIQLSMLLVMMVVHMYNNGVLTDDYLKYIDAVVVDNVLMYMNSNNKDDADDHMMDEFLRKYWLIHDEMRMFDQNWDVVDYVSYEDLNSNYVSLLMMDIDYEQSLLSLME